MREPDSTTATSVTWWTCPECSEWHVGDTVPDDLAERECFAHIDEGIPCRWVIGHVESASGKDSDHA